MRCAEGGAVGCVRGREGGAILEGRKTYASAGRHSNGDAPDQNDWWQTVLLVGCCKRSFSR